MEFNECGSYERIRMLRIIESLLIALDSQEDTPTKRLFIEIILDYMSRCLPDAAHVAWMLVKNSVDKETYSQNKPKWFNDDFKIGIGARPNIAVDIFILAVKDVEKTAVLEAFIVNKDKVFVDSTTHRQLWTVNYKGYNIGIGWVGEDGLVESAIAMAQYATFVSFERACLIGMAAGRVGKVALGSIVVASIVHDYDRRCVNRGSDGIQKDRPERRSAQVDERFLSKVRGIISQCQGCIPEWLKNVTNEMREISKVYSIPDDSEMESQEDMRSVLVKPSISGGALLEDYDVVESLIESYDREAVIADMESYGFAKWCSKNISYWLVIRGVSDFCDRAPSGSVKKGRSKEWQYPATYYAARFLKDHLLLSIVNDDGL